MKRSIGFKRSEEREIEVSNNSLPATNEDRPSEISVPMSSAQVDLLETIQNLSEIIVDKSFAKFAENQRVLFIKQLINAVSLNSELTTKTAMLMV
jgi:hypothetical protein